MGIVPIDPLMSLYLFPESRELKDSMPPCTVQCGYREGRHGGGEEMSTSRMLPFAVARAIVRKLKLKSQKEWREWKLAVLAQKLLRANRRQHRRTSTNTTHCYR